jgi:hypothetical protein
LSMSLEAKSWHRQVDAKKKRRQAAALQKGRKPEMYNRRPNGLPIV